MADINIEKKSGMSWLWLLLGLIVLAFVAWLLLADRGDPLATDTIEQEPAAEVITTPIEPAGTGTLAEVEEFAATCADRAPGEMGLDHQYTSDCIDRLVRSVEATLAQPNLAQVNAMGELQEARTAADRLSESAVEGDHSRMTQEALTSVAALFDRVQEDRFPALNSQVEELQQTAQEISADQPLLEQRQPVQDFFQQAATVLNGFGQG